MHSVSALPAQDRAAIGADTTDEAALVRAAQAQPAAFAMLYRRYFERIYAYLRSRTAGEEDAADLTQQVFLQALDALPRFRQGRVPFAAWLFRIAHNAAIDHHRRRRPALDWDLLPLPLHPRADDDAAARLIRQEDAAYLRDLLAALDLETREMLALRFSAGLTAPEIAAVMGKSEAATKKRLARAMQTLKERSHAIDR